MPKLPIITASNLSKSYGPDVVFETVSFHLSDGEYVGLVGINGSGKSTLLRIVAGIDSPTSGSVSIRRGSRVTYLPQEPRYTSARSVIDEAKLAFAPVLESAARMREIEALLSDNPGETVDHLLEEYANLQHRFEVHGGFDVEFRTEEILAGLGFTGDQLDQPVRRLSGGQRTRVALAKALLSDPDVLLLDEPTNHLDVEMLEWLESFLASWGGTYVVVSHDRFFLDRVTNRTLDLSFARLEDYNAGYSGYVKQKAEREARLWKEYLAQQEHIARTEEYIRKYKAGQRAREARGRQKKLDRLERIEPPRSSRELNISIGASSRTGDNVLRTSQLEIGHVDKLESGGTEQDLLVRVPELEVRRGDRVGLIGPNGGGKTTLLRTLVGELDPLAGRIEYGTGVEIGYYAQAHEQLPRSGNPLSAVTRTQPMEEGSARSYLGKFLFSDDDVFKPVDSLSGGERSRLALAMLLLQRFNVLVLDEPTNHLDIGAREALEEMLDEFDGTILFVSHDRYFVDRIANHIWNIHDGSLEVSLGGYSDFMRAQTRRRTYEDEELGGDPAPDSESLDNGSQTATDETGIADMGEGQRKKALVRVERRIASLEGELNQISDDLSVAEIDQDYEQMADLSLKRDELSESLDDCYAEWDELAQVVEESAEFAGIST